MPRNAQNALVIFAKWPLTGQVKTRLCPPLSLEQAAELARCFLLDSVERACSVSNVQVWIAFAPMDSEPLFRGLLPFPVQYIPQRGDSLGERELNVFVDVLSAEYPRVVIIGSDVPTVPLDYLRQAFERLGDPSCQAVFGPSSDGGYYLVGANTILPQLFENIAWSTSHVMAQTLAQARRHQLRVALTPEWHDVDTPTDLRRLAAELDQTQECTQAPRTRRLLTRLRLIQPGL